MMTLSSPNPTRTALGRDSKCTFSCLRSPVMSIFFRLGMLNIKESTWEYGACPLSSKTTKRQSREANSSLHVCLEDCCHTGFLCQSRIAFHRCLVLLHLLFLSWFEGPNQFFLVHGSNQEMRSDAPEVLGISYLTVARKEGKHLLLLLTVVHGLVHLFHELGDGNVGGCQSKNSSLGVTLEDGSHN
uniref:Uncharacterized protein n=1 Tax=Meloidogyne incognita TaxID=6306 RepID=A0A914L6P3_MELIC